MGGPTRPNPHQALSPASSSSSAEAVGGGVVEVIRSEERAHLSTEVKVSGRAVLRKYIVTETVTQTFQVRHEEVRVEHEPATDGAAASPQRSVFDDRVVEVTLHREVPVVQMQVVATERVLLHVDTVTEQVEVSADLRKEQLELDTTP